MESWKPVVGFEDKYEVSNFGRVRSLSTGNIMKPRSCPQNGYLRINLNTGRGVKKTVHIHKMVAQAWLGHVPEGFRKGSIVIDHIDRDRQNNHIDNLQLITQSRNLERRKWKMDQEMDRAIKNAPF